MTKKLFCEDPYLFENTAVVTSVNGDDVTLDQTVAYAYSGGQESDYGTIGGYQILEARKDGKEIIYTLDNHDLNVGDEVAVKIDGERRYRLMRLHSCGDIVLQIMLKKHPDLERIGAHVSEDKSRIDFDMDFNISTLFDYIDEELERIIAEDYEIIKGFIDEENQVRYWKMTGYGPVNCGGTHIKKTGELEKIKLKRRNLGKNKERIEMMLVD